METIPCCMFCKHSSVSLQSVDTVFVWKLQILTKSILSLFIFYVFHLNLVRRASPLIFYLLVPFVWAGRSPGQWGEGFAGRYAGVEAQGKGELRARLGRDRTRVT